jgi:hypothetical protein
LQGTELTIQIAHASEAELPGGEAKAKASLSQDKIDEITHEYWGNVVNAQVIPLTLHSYLNPKDLSVFHDAFISGDQWAKDLDALIPYLNRGMHPNDPRFRSIFDLSERFPQAHIIKRYAKSVFAARDFILAASPLEEMSAMIKPGNYPPFLYLSLDSSSAFDAALTRGEQWAKDIDTLFWFWRNSTSIPYTG